jgi:uncharacterized membrane protein YgcG
MPGYRLSPIRNKGWLRLGLAGAVAMIPYTAMEHAQGRFSEGPAGLQQAAEFLAGGMAVWLVIGFALPWVMHGFAVRVKDEDEEEGSRRSGGGGGLGGGVSHGGPPPSHGGAPSHGGGPKAH